MRVGVRALVGKVWGRLLAGRDEDGQFPDEFHRTMAKGGWLGMTMLEEIEGKTGQASDPVVTSEEHVAMS
jgi:acyl-CoA dehydrogenase